MLTSTEIEDLKRLRRMGYSLTRHITSRAALMCRHLESGNTARAEEYAADILHIQGIWDAVWYGGERDVDRQDCTTRYILTLEAWGDLLKHAPRVGRDLNHHSIQKYRPEQVMLNPIYAGRAAA